MLNRKSKKRKSKKKSRAKRSLATRRRKSKKKSRRVATKRRKSKRKSRSVTTRRRKSYKMMYDADDNVDFVDVDDDLYLEYFNIKVYSLETYLSGVDKMHALKLLFREISEGGFCKAGHGARHYSSSIIQNDFLLKNMKKSLLDKKYHMLCLTFTKPFVRPLLLGFCILSDGCGDKLDDKNWITIQIFCIDPEYRILNKQEKSIKLSDLFLKEIKDYARKRSKNKIAIDIAGGWWVNKPSYNFFKRNGAKPWDPKFGKCFDSSPTWRGVGPLLSNYNPLYDGYSMYIDLE